MLLSSVLSSSTFKGDPGTTGIVTVTGVTPVAANVSPSITQIGGGTSSTTMSFNLPVAPTVTLNATPAITLYPNQSPTVSSTITGTGDTVLQFSIPSAPSVTIGTVTTGAAGSSAAVTNVGTNGNVVLNITIPTGATGPAGSVNAVGSHLLPTVNNTYDLGSSTLRWRNIYTNDLQLSNGIGDYTIVEGEEDLFLYNNKNGKTYKFVIQEVDPSKVPSKAKVD